MNKKTSHSDELRTMVQEAFPETTRTPEDFTDRLMDRIHAGQVTVEEQMDTTTLLVRSRWKTWFFELLFSPLPLLIALLALTYIMRQEVIGFIIQLCQLLAVRLSLSTELALPIVLLAISLCIIGTWIMLLDEDQEYFTI